MGKLKNSRNCRDIAAKALLIITSTMASIFWKLSKRACPFVFLTAVCTENLIRIDQPKESPNLSAA